LTREIADEAARLQADMKRSGTPLGWHDLQIAAAAMYLREPLVSNDKVFAKVPGLQLLDH
jgi:predicted nucleic acid-binding protein